MKLKQLIYLLSLSLMPILMTAQGGITEIAHAEPSNSKNFDRDNAVCLRSFVAVFNPHDRKKKWFRSKPKVNFDKITKEIANKLECHVNCDILSLETSEEYLFSIVLRMSHECTKNDEINNVLSDIGFKSILSKEELNYQP